MPHLFLFFFPFSFHYILTRCLSSPFSLIRLLVRAGVGPPRGPGPPVRDHLSPRRRRGANRREAATQLGYARGHLVFGFRNLFEYIFNFLIMSMSSISPAIHESNTSILLIASLHSYHSVFVPLTHFVCMYFSRFAYFSCFIFMSPPHTDTPSLLPLPLLRVRLLDGQVPQQGAPAQRGHRRVVQTDRLRRRQARDDQHVCV